MNKETRMFNYLCRKCNLIFLSSQGTVANICPDCGGDAVR